MTKNVKRFKLVHFFVKIVIAVLVITVANFQTICAQDVKTMLFRANHHAQLIGYKGDIGYFAYTENFSDTTFLHHIHMRRATKVRIDTIINTVFQPEVFSNDGNIIYGSSKFLSVGYLRYHIDTKKLDTIPLGNSLGGNVRLISQLKHLPNAYLFSWFGRIYLQVNGVVSPNFCEGTFGQNNWAINESESIIYWYDNNSQYIRSATIDQSGLMARTPFNKYTTSLGKPYSIGNKVITESGLILEEQSGTLARVGDLTMGRFETMKILSLVADTARNTWVAVAGQTEAFGLILGKKLTFDATYFQLLEKRNLMYLDDNSLWANRIFAWDTIGIVNTMNDFDESALRISHLCTPTITSVPALAYPLRYFLCPTDTPAIEAPVGYPDSAYYWPDYKRGRIRTIVANNLYTTSPTNISYQLIDQNGCISKPSPITELYKKDIDIEDFLVTKEPYHRDVPMCIGSKANLRVTYDAHVKLNFAWSTGDTTELLPITQPGTYKITIFDDDNCIFHNTYSIEIPGENAPLPPKPTIEILSSNGQGVFCSNEIKTMASSVANDVTYEWTDGVATTESRRIIASAGVYRVCLVSKDGCVSDYSDPVNIQFEDIPAKPTINRQGTVLVSSSLTGNQWYLDGNLLQSENLNHLKLTQSGTYQLRVIGKYGCISEFSNPINH